MKREALYGNYKIKGIYHDGLVNVFNREVVSLAQLTSVVKCGSRESKFFGLCYATVL